MKTKKTLFVSITLLFIVFMSCQEEFSTLTSDNFRVNITATEITPVNGSSAFGNITIDSANLNRIIEIGFCWDTIENVNLESSKSKVITQDDSNSALLDNLNANTKYFVKSYARTSYTVFYGNEISFSTTDGLAVLDTCEATDITQNSAKISSEIIDNGGFPISEAGFCWSKTNKTPTINDKYKEADNISNIFESTITNLEFNSKYYIRSYAKNEIGISYGKESYFNTAKGLPILDYNVMQIEMFGAGIVIDIINNGGASIIESGIIYSTSPNLDLTDSISIAQKTSVNSYHSWLFLEKDTKYYFKAYATTSVGTGFSDEGELTTSDGLANVDVYLPLEVKQNSAIIPGYVELFTYDSELIEFGICYSQMDQPTIEDSVAICADPKEKIIRFKQPLNNLEQNTHYYYRCFAKTIYGVSYSDVKQFYTNNLPVQPLEFITIEGGKFTMGNNNGEADESPEHEVELSSFQMSSTEVTFNQYIEFLKEAEFDNWPYFKNEDGQSVSAFRFDSEDLPSGIYFNTETTDQSSVFFNNNIYVHTPDCPVYGITYHGAKKYCEWVGGRLPTEAEWEYAARGGNLSNYYIYSGSDNADEVAWYSENSNNRVHKVGQKKPNELGLFDMTGNVNEICLDGYYEDFYSKSPQFNPVNEKGTYCSVRGSDFQSPLNELYLTNRFFIETYYYENFFIAGFRVVKDIE